MFEVGDLVRVKKDATCVSHVLDFPFNMNKYRGNVYEIQEYGIEGNRNWYYLCGCTHEYDNWIFDESWLELVGKSVSLDINESEIEDLLCLK